MDIGAKCVMLTIKILKMVQELENINPPRLNAKKHNTQAFFCLTLTGYFS